MTDVEYIQRRIERTEAMIAAYEDAIEALATGTAVSYMIDSGVTRQQVTRAQLSELRLVLRELETRRGRLLRERDGGEPVVGRPAF